MIVWAYTIVRNEASIIERWLKHYGTFCDKLIVYDDESDDGTQHICRAHNADVRTLPYSGLDDGLQAAFSAQMYREARGQADFVVVVDADEILHGTIDPSFVLPHVVGYQMHSETDGVPYGPESKPCVFRPELDLWFGVGRHTCNKPFTHYGTGLKLLHYRYLSREQAIARSARNFERLPEQAQAFRWGFHTSPEERGHWADNQDALMRHAGKVI